MVKILPFPSLARPLAAPHTARALCLLAMSEDLATLSAGLSAEAQELLRGSRPTGEDHSVNGRIGKALAFEFLTLLDLNGITPADAEAVSALGNWLKERQA